MSFSDEFLDDLRDRVPLSALVGRKVAWNKHKTQSQKGIWWACCPFHGEKTASFKVDDSSGRFHCFGCKESGDHFSWLMKDQRASFPEAVSQVAEMAGVPLPALSPQQAQKESLRRDLFDINEAAARWFHAQLRDPVAGKAARSYLRGRGVSEGQWARFQLGVAPFGQGLLVAHLKTQGFAEDAIVTAGLARDGVGGNAATDFFRDRLMFPIRDARGRCVGFGGRALKADDKIKYLNTRETPVFDKHRLLYNHDRAAGARSGRLVVVEGYMDVLALDAVGVEHVVAPMGTALGPEQLKLAWRMADEPVIMLDGDAAGLKAMGRVLREAMALLGPGKSLGFALLPDGADPDDVGKTCFGAARLLGLLARPLPLIDMLWRKLLADADVTTPERAAKFEAEVVSAVALIGDPSVRQQYEAEMAERLKAFWRDQGKKRKATKFARGDAASGGGVPPGGPGGGGAGSGGGVPEWDGGQVDAMNKRFALVVAGQRTAVLMDSAEDLGDSIDRLRMLNVDAFRILFMNRRARVGRSVDTLGNLWLGDWRRRQYKGLEFVPSPPGRDDGHKDFFNLWRGFSVVPKANPALAQPWLDHMFENVADGNEHHFNWAVSWFAWPIQRPAERSNVSLVLRGGQGTGKTITGAIVGRLYPANYYLVDDPRYLTGQFNAHLSSCLLLQVDEGFWAGNKQAEGRLKGLVTAREQMIEYKGVDPVRAKNHVNLLISSNEDFVVPAGLRERRFAVLDVGSGRQQDIDYFRKLDETYRQPEALAALLAALMEWKIDEAVLRKVPQTAALFDQKVRSFDSFLGWLHEMLLDGALAAGGEWPTHIETHDLHGHYLRRAERLGHHYPLSIDSFGRRLRSVIKGIERRQNAQRKWCYLLPGLDVCRDDFEQAVDAAIDWTAGGEGGLERRMAELGITATNGPGVASRRARGPGSGESGGEVVNDF